MEKLEVKNCIETYQLDLIKKLEAEFNEVKDAAHIDPYDVKDMDAGSHQAQSTVEEQRINDQIERAKDDLEHLKGIPFHESSIVEEGAVLTTEDLTIYVGLSTTIIKNKGENIVGISTQSPLYKKLKGHKTGFKFNMMDKPCSIISVE